ncbi:Cys-tRNA(Pro) deacylase [Rhodococcoides kyotonense]|uniref:Cys-tRNA(Pro)/Cys-tRNA(Cys) deacylase n=1 Tax=Rhodococcoides kyotonense TaxID=398843 RepID=A0A239LVE8_9NOCA|nr:Cys-tRNA(Pro) deacylase [Rhodococcus kyotonensis]SNT33932.1 Cys-tRNA(Pro)/Cys-tRNA(Cys) deacylase [Rhodococcus kyotonensis]
MAAASTPAIAVLARAKVDHEVHTYDHDPRSESFGTEAADILCERLGVERAQIFKTLVIRKHDGKLAVAVLPVTKTLSLKSAAAALDTRKVAMAERGEAERSSGYVFGGISPLGQKRALPTVVDDSALGWDRVLCSGGRRGLEIELDPRELVRLTHAVTAPIVTT